ncbi:hypothetical protein BJ322DRAFT_1112343 [Thelephora terrestris]|uniref:Uncharacterized protein n=1 Tax=Thelephora terrestris TaxID=56493 RepID=A0A9P6H8U4_9AGAM|nr:hypothetical protein BJ322DRAFT_1113013 [Thelephora terrestris]KAF9780958.1 hypothetical protein BJ322DRAFT_1112343 [Thelephora terrestris]
MDLNLILHNPEESLRSNVPSTSTRSVDDPKEYLPPNIPSTVARAKVYVEKLKLSPEQKQAVERLYERGETLLAKFEEVNQASAQGILAEHNLPKEPNITQLAQWTSPWHNEWAFGETIKRRELFQCSSQARRTKGNHASQGCLAHADITWIYTPDSPRIERIMGYLQHGCEMTSDTSWEEAKRYMKKLNLKPEQWDTVSRLYQNGEGFLKEFDTQAATQASARDVLAQHKLPKEPEAELEMEWVAVQTSVWGAKSGVRKRLLFSAVSSSHRWSSETTQTRSNPGSSQKQPEPSGQSDHESLECLAHAEVTWNTTPKELQIQSIRGYLDHSLECEASTRVRD